MTGQRRDAEAGSAGSEHLGLRVGLGLGFALLGAAVTWRLGVWEPWLRAHQLWTATMAAVLALMTIPLRVAFLPSPAAMTRAQALRHYSALTGVAVGVSLGLPMVLAGLARFLDDSVATVVVGMFLFLVLLGGVPRVMLARRRREPLGHAFASMGKIVLLAGSIVALVLVVLGLRSLGTRPSRPPVVAKVPAAALDPLRLDEPQVERWTVSDGDGKTLWLQVDGGTLERTLARLEAAAMTSLAELRKTPKATGLVVCRVPRRLRTPEAEREVLTRQEKLSASIDGSGVRTLEGRQLRVLFEFAR